MFPLQWNNSEIIGENPGADFSCSEVLCSLQVETALVVTEVPLWGQRLSRLIASGLAQCLSPVCCRGSESCGSASSSSEQRHLAFRYCWSLKTCRQCRAYRSFYSFRASHKTHAFASTRRRELVPKKAVLYFSEERSCPPCIIYHIYKINLCVFDLNLKFPLGFIIHCVFEGIFNNFSS